MGRTLVTRNQSALRFAGLFAQATASRCSTEGVGGRYRLDKLLGSGGAADVHRGFDLRLRRPVAVKTDTADMYGQGESEGIVGKTLRERAVTTS
jgi:eukaryotic-like serine/threonine-protein kinase